MKTFSPLAFGRAAAFVILITAPSITLLSVAASGQVPTATSMDASHSGAVVSPAIREIIRLVAGGNIDLAEFEPFTPLRLADFMTILAQRDDARGLDSLLKAGVDPNLLNSSGTSGLHGAVMANSIASARVLIAAGARIDLDSEFGSPEEFARNVGSVEMRRLFPAVEAGASAMLRQGIILRDLVLVREAIAGGADVSEADAEGYTPLHDAIGRDEFEIAKALLEADASITAKTHDGLTPLALAVMHGNVKLVNLLINFGADVDARVGALPLMSVAVIAGHDEIVAVLLDAGASIEATVENKMRPAVLARILNNEKLVNLLGGAPELDEEIDLIQLLVAGDFVGVVKALAGGANPDVKSSDGTPFVILAAALGDAETFEAIIRANADLQVEDRNGATPLNAALVNEDEAAGDKIVSLVLERASGKLFSNMLENTDQNGRRTIVTLATRTGVDFSENSAFQRSLGTISSTSRNDLLAGFTDGEMSALMAATIVGNVELVKAAKRYEVPLFKPHGISLQDIARTQGRYEILAHLPDDRALPPGLMRGASRNVKVEVQLLLQQWGYYSGAIDGAIGPASRAAMIAFLNDRAVELRAMAEASDLVTKNTNPPSSASVPTLDIEWRPSPESCIWNLVEWQGLDGKRTTFTGCIHPSENAWNTNGFALHHRHGQAPVVELFGATGWASTERF